MKPSSPTAFSDSSVVYGYIRNQVWIWPEKPYRPGETDMMFPSVIEHAIQGHFQDRKATPDDGYPMVGDAVILTAEWSLCRPGQIGIINGLVGRAPEELHITWNYSAYRSDQEVSCSGGPGTLCLDYRRLIRRVCKTVDIRFWRWRNGFPEGGGGEDYMMAVPLWEWDGQSKPVAGH